MKKQANERTFQGIFIQVIDEIISENLFLISESIELILNRFANIRKPDDFVLDDNGVTILDSIAMRLQVVGELLKKIDHEIIYDICQNHLPLLKKIILTMLK